MTKVLKAMAFRPARGQWQYRIFAIQGLNVRLLIDAKHCRMGRRVQVQANDVRRLLLKVRIVRGHVALDALGLESMLAPHPRHHHVADIQMRRELARRPMGRTARRVARALQNPRFQLRGEYRGHLADVAAVEPGDPLLREIAGSSWPQSLGYTRSVPKPRPTYGHRPAARSAGLVGHLRPDPCGCWQPSRSPGNHSRAT